MRVTPDVTDSEIVKFVRDHQARGQVVQLFATDPCVSGAPGIGDAWLKMCNELREQVGGFDLELPQRSSSRPVELW